MDLPDIEIKTWAGALFGIGIVAGVAVYVLGSNPSFAQDELLRLANTTMVEWRWPVGIEVLVLVALGVMIVILLACLLLRLLWGLVKGALNLD